jgi:hypothetical protein
MIGQRRLSRRSVIAGSAAAAAGATGVAVLGTGSPAGAEVSAAGSGRARIARVLRHGGATAEVEVLSASGSVLEVRSAPVTGFPDGWRLRRGDRVLLTGASAGMVMPLVEPIQGRLSGGGQSSAQIGGRAIIVRDAAATDEDAAGGDSVAFCVRNDADGTLSAVSVRPASAFAVPPR